jgi:hypothetical protein
LKDERPLRSIACKKKILSFNYLNGMSLKNLVFINYKKPNTDYMIFCLNLKHNSIFIDDCAAFEIDTITKMSKNLYKVIDISSTDPHYLNLHNQEMVRMDSGAEIFGAIYHKDYMTITLKEDERYSSNH